MDNSELEPVMLALGRAVYSAQHFEMMLGSTLIALTIAKGDRSKVPDQAAAQRWLGNLNRSTLGKVRKQIVDLDLLPDAIVTEIIAVNERRNEVVHHFMSRWADRMETDDGMLEAIDYLDTSADNFITAAEKLQAGIERMRDLGLTQWRDPA